MKKPDVETSLRQLEDLLKWCQDYSKMYPTNGGTWNPAMKARIDAIYKPLRDEVIFYSSGWGWRLRKFWLQTIETRMYTLNCEKTGQAVDPAVIEEIWAPLNKREKAGGQ